MELLIVGGGAIAFLLLGLSVGRWWVAAVPFFLAATAMFVLVAAAGDASPQDEGGTGLGAYLAAIYGVVLTVATLGGVAVRQVVAPRLSQARVSQTTRQQR